jgi:acyl-CoA reductase-like NAD-dependent aldehyde dehydrogenase
LRDLIARAGFDPELVALLPESPEAARAAIGARPDKVLFTGSAATGEKILAQLAPHLIPATMELSGCDAVIIRADADLDLAVKALVFGLRLNSGATCMSPRRVFVARSIATEFEGRLARAFNFRSSQGEEAQTSILADQRLHTSAVNEEIRPLLDDAIAGGAYFIAGVMRFDGAILTPLVLGGLSPEASLLHEDIFAPILCVVTVAGDKEALARTNDSPFALAASIFTRDESAARALAIRVNAGVVTINDLIIPTADARLPFGGRKRSGFGVTRGAQGLLELTTPKVITVTRGKFRPAFDAPQPGDTKMFQAYLRLSYGRGLKTRWVALISLFQCVLGRKKSSRKETV